MLKTTLKSLLVRKLRLFTSGFAVLLGVAFMAGTLVLTDTIGKTFDDLFADVNAGTDAYVRGEAAFSSTELGDQRPRIDASLVDAVAGVEGVAAAEGSIQGYAQIVGKDGEAVGGVGGAPTLGANWGTVDEFNPFTIVDGRAPQADDEVVIDRSSADSGDLAVGDATTVLTQAGSTPVRVVGIATFGDADSAAGSSIVGFTDPAAQRLVAEPGKFDAVAVLAEDGVAQAELADRVARALPAGVEVLTGEQLAEESASDVKQALGFFSAFLQAFAAIALFVGSFIIYNTFSILVAQRTRENALLRAIGASRKQVTRSVLVEATVVGLLASVLGIALGVGVAAGLKALLAGFGIDIPASGIVLDAGTVVTALVAGLSVAVSSAWLPARRAAKVPPVAAMRDVAVDASASSRLRVLGGLAVVALGAASLLVGLFGDADNPLPLVGLGAVVLFVGVAVLGPVIARPVAGAIGAPLPALKGMTGTLARENATRNPKRTSSTAAALMIGVALVGGITVLASSLKESINGIVDRSLGGDFAVTTASGGGFGGFPPELAARLGELPEVDVASSVRAAPARVDDSTTFLTAVDPASVSRFLDVGVTEGSLSDLDRDGIAVFEETATEKGWSLGSRVPVRFAETGDQELTVAAIYDENALAGSYLVGLPAYEANVAQQLDFEVRIAKAEGADAASARSAIEAVLADYPTAELQDQSEYKESQASSIDQVLNLVYALLALAVVIALLGIANTLALSVFERTRELGLLRAVGTTRAQLRSAVRWESVIIALFGTLLGLVIGLFFGWALVQALAEEGFDRFVVPGGQLAVIALVAALAGVVAAVLPARRAAKLDVLKSIATT